MIKKILPLLFILLSACATSNQKKTSHSDNLKNSNQEEVCFKGARYIKFKLPSGEIRHAGPLVKTGFCSSTKK